MKNKLVILLCIILILLVLLIVILVNIKNKSNSNFDDYTHKSTEEYYEDKIFPAKFSKLEIGYNGKNDLVNIYKKTYLLINKYIPSINNIESSTAVLEYYEKNKETLETDLGIVSENEFKMLYSDVYNKEDLKYISCEILVDSIQKEDNKINFDLKIIYENNIQMVVKVEFSTNKDGIIKFL